MPPASRSSNLSSLPPLDDAPVFDMLDELGFRSARPSITPFQPSAHADATPGYNHSEDRLSSVMGNGHGTADEDPEDGDHDSADGEGLDESTDKGAPSNAGQQGAGGRATEQPSDAKQSTANADGKTNKAHKKRNRKPSSCAQCRKKKLRCDRQAPCGACMLRGEPTLCSWEDAVPLLLGRTENDATELKLQVDRLQGLIDYLCRKAPEQAPVFATPAQIQGQYSLPYSTPSDAISDPAASNSAWTSHHLPPVSYQPPIHGSTLGSNLSSHNPPIQQSHRPSHTSVCSAFEHSNDPSRDGSEQACDWSPKTETRHYLKGVDLAEALSHLAISHISSSHSATARGSGEKSQNNDLVNLEDAKKFVGLPAQFGLAQQPFSSTHSREQTDDKDSESTTYGPGRLKMTMSGLPFGNGPADGLKAIKDCFPSDQQAKSALMYYVKYVDWYFHVLHLPSFETQLSDMRSKPLADVDPFFLASFLGIVGIGVAMQPAARALRDGFGTPAQRDAIADKFLQAAMHALMLGRFLDKPSVEAIRAILICNTFFVFMDAGEQTGSGMGLLSLAIQIALQLGLHRDPDKTPGLYDPVQTESRRRLFWTLCSFECLASSALGRSYSVFNLDNVDTKFPRDLDDDEITPDGILQREDPTRETVMTSLIIRMKIGVVAKRISDKAFGIAPISYATVMELNRELRKQERDLPPHYQLRYDESSGVFALPSSGTSATSLRFYMIHISLQMEYLRLHRPFLIKATSSAETAASRHICVRAARILLAIQRQPACQQNWGGLLYKSLSAAIVLSLDLLQDPYASYADLYRAEIRAIVVTMNRYAVTSSLCRKGVRVLGFLMDREQQLLQSHLDRTSKRARRSEGAGSMLGGISQMFSIAPMPVPNIQNVSSPEEEPRRKKAPTSRDDVGPRRSIAEIPNATQPTWLQSISQVSGEYVAEPLMQVSSATLGHISPTGQDSTKSNSYPFDHGPNGWDPHPVNAGAAPPKVPTTQLPKTSSGHDSIPAGNLPSGFHDPISNLPPRPQNTDIPHQYHFDFRVEGLPTPSNTVQPSITRLPNRNAATHFSSALSGYDVFSTSFQPHTNEPYLSPTASDQLADRYGNSIATGLKTTPHASTTTLPRQSSVTTGSEPAASLLSNHETSRNDAHRYSHSQLNSLRQPPLTPQQHQYRHYNHLQPGSAPPTLPVASIPSPNQSFNGTNFPSPTYRHVHNGVISGSTSESLSTTSTLVGHQDPHHQMNEWKDLQAYGLPTELEWQGVLGQGVLGK